MPFEPVPVADKPLTRKELGRRALKTIADSLLTQPPAHFNMAYWCGTACCAIGHTYKLPEVKATGLRMVPTGIAVKHLARHPEIQAADGTVTGLFAIGEAFSIPQNDADDLFAFLPRNRHITPQDKAKDIYYYLETGQVCDPL